MQKFESYYNHKVNLQVFKENDYVYLLKKPLRDKFNEQYKGSYKILETPGNVKLAINNKRIRIVHSNKLKIYKIYKIRPTCHNTALQSPSHLYHYLLSLPSAGD